MAAPLIVAADAAPDVGLGHVSRAGALAAGLRARGFDTRCVGLGATAPLRRDGVEWEPFPEIGAFAGDVAPGATLVLDSYKLPQRDRETLAGATRLAVFDDGENHVPDGVRLVLGVNESDGFDYVCLRPQFWGIPSGAALFREVGEVLVTTGGGDPGGWRARLVSAARDAQPELPITVVGGPRTTESGVTVLDSPESLLEPLMSADVAITAAGQTMFESAAVGTPTIAVVVADNQRRQARMLEAAGAVRVIDPPDADGVARALTELVEDFDERTRMVGRARRAVDGYGALRGAFAVASLHTRADA